METGMRWEVLRGLMNISPTLSLSLRYAQGEQENVPTVSDLNMQHPSLHQHVFLNFLFKRDLI